MSKNNNSKIIFKFSKNCEILQDTCNFIVKEGSNFSYFPTLEASLYYVYEESIKDKLAEEQCKSLLEIAEKIQECSHNMRLFISKNIQQ
jgi:hypothetical protein